MSFDPSQPFTIEDSPKVTTKGFDPSKPFEVETAPAFDPSKAHAVEHQPDEADQKPGFLSKAADSLESGLKTIGQLPADYARFQIDAAKQVAKAQGEDLSTWYADKPGYTYGAVLPFRKNDKTGEVEWGYSPESARAIMRAAGHTLDFDISNPEHRSDVTALAVAMSGLHRAPGSIPSASPLGATPPRAEPTFGEPPAGPAPDVPFGAQHPALTGPPGEPPAPTQITTAQVQARDGVGAVEAGRRAAAENAALAAPQQPSAPLASSEPQPQPPAAAPPLAIEAPPPAADPWLPVAEAPTAEPQAETPIAAPTAEPTPPAAQEVSASDLKPGDQVLVGDKTHEVEKVRPWTGDQVAVKLKDDPKLHIGAPDQPVQRVPSPEAPAPESTLAAPPLETAFGGPWVRVKTKAGEDASNRQGEALYENANGVRATFDNGVPHTESVTEHPERGLIPKNAIDRRGQFLTVEETGLGAAPPKTRDEPKKDAPVKPEIKPEQPKAPTNPVETKPEWTEIGKNEDGLPVFTNEAGVHSTVKNGIRTVESVRMRPTREGMRVSVPAPEDKAPEFQVAKAPEPRPDSTPAEKLKRPYDARLTKAEDRAANKLAVDALNGDITEQEAVAGLGKMVRDGLIPEGVAQVSLSRLGGVTEGDWEAAKAAEKPSTEVAKPEAAKARARREVVPFVTEPREPRRLTQFLREDYTIGRAGDVNSKRVLGGLRDPGGDLASIIGGKRGVPETRGGRGFRGLINETGANLDDAALRAWEAGYFPEHTERPTINELLDKIDEDVNRGNPQYSHHDQTDVEAYQAAIGRNREIDRLAGAYEIPTRGLTHDQFFDALADKASLDELAAERAALEQAHEDAYWAFETAGKGLVGEDWKPDEFHGSDQDRSLEDLEDEYRQEVAAAEAQQRSGGGQELQPAASAEGAGEEGGGHVGGTPGPSGRDEAEDGARETDLLGHAIRAPSVRKSEPTIRNDPNQAIMPGMEASAVQAQAARDAAGPRSGQERANEGLFAAPEIVQPELIREIIEPQPEVVTHVTKRGKTLTGTIRTDLNATDAKALDPYTFKKDGGWFIRVDAKASPTEVSKPSSEGQDPTAEEAKPDPAVVVEVTKRQKQVTWLRDVATRMQQEAENDEGRDRRSGTARQARMAASAVADAHGRLQTATTMQNLADAVEGGEVLHLSGVRSRADVEQLGVLLRQSRIRRQQAEKMPYAETEREKGAPITDADMAYAKMPSVYIHPAWAKDAAAEIERYAQRGNTNIIRWLRDAQGNDTINPGPEKVEQLREALTAVRKKTSKLPSALGRIAESLADRDRITKLGIANDADLSKALTEFNRYRGARKEESPITKLERQLIGSKPGVDFFPTPKALVDRMVEEADIKPGMRVLEPSAGKGDIADAVRDAGANVDTVEMSNTLRDILAAKKHEVVGQDFMEFQPTEGYDRIIMNPPFSNNLDAAHVQRAYEMLKPDGRLVAITGEGVHFRSDKVATAFREWLDEHNAQVEKLPEGSFKSAFRPTGVATRIVILDKPKDAP